MQRNQDRIRRSDSKPTAVQQPQTTPVQQTEVDSSIIGELFDELDCAVSKASALLNSQATSLAKLREDLFGGKREGYKAVGILALSESVADDLITSFEQVHTAVFQQRRSALKVGL